MYIYEQGPWLILPDGTNTWRPSRERLIVKPDSEKRVKPEDLFASSTDRSTFSSDQTNVLYQPWSYDGSPLAVLSAGRETDFDFSRLNERANSRMLAEIKRQNVNLAQMMAEYRSTAKLFSSLSSELWQGYKALKRGHWVDFGRDLKRSRAFSKKWIEFQFGLVPVVMDLEGVCLSLADKLREGTFMYKKITVSDQQRSERRYLNPEGNGYLLHIEYEHRSIKLNARWTIRDEMLDDISRFGFSNVPALLWELVPFSFVVDWAIGVGSWLENLDSLIAVGRLDVNVGTRSKWSALTEDLRSGAVATVSTDLRSRSITQRDLPNPTPRYEPSQSLKSIVTGLALLRLLNR